ncbi:DUF4920 domain-containing protein [Lishizhenia sp.]|uniref:DUF4920 domain-containing protein n=1 Tax=Lishizhenia sp. TaxID=2497594 RepID=UPI00299D8621|nr:DUF4920 domain-containing protein [Lishizhenia sp.]MDX1445261.1 DUF4920 domain-containing protein [Lishizhenia sp.]
MKKVLMAFTAAALLASCGNNAEETTTPAEGVENHEGHENHEGEDHTGHEHSEMDENKTEFGAVAVNKEEAISTEELLTQFEGQTEMAATFKGELTGVCTKMGCWVKVKHPAEGEDFMVRFVDHFTIPTTTEMGTIAYLTGTAKQDTTSVDDQIHLLEDGGMSHDEAAAQVTGPKYGMTFYADGIALEAATAEEAPATETETM